MFSRLRTKIFLIISTLFLFSQLVYTQSYNLTGAWKDDNSVTYCIRQIGNRLFWKMDDRPRVHNIFHGIIANQYITGEWADLPGGKLVGNGTLALKIESNNRLVKISQTSNYLGSVWMRIDDSECSEVAQTKEPRSGTDLTGTWIVRWTDPYAYYLIKWQIEPIDNGKWKVLSTLLETNHSYNRRFVCKTEPGGTIQMLQPGKFTLSRESNASDPGNPGYFKQIMTLTLNKDKKNNEEKLIGEGTHKGSKITHWIKLEGKRGDDNRCD